MKVRSDECHHAMKASSAHRTVKSQKSSAIEANLATADKLQAFADGLTANALRA